MKMTRLLGVGLFSLVLFPGLGFARKPTAKPATRVAKGVPIPPAKAGKGKMAGWTLYKKVHITPKKAKQVGLDQSTPAKLAVSFMASVVRGDKDYMKLISPNMKAAVRKHFRASRFKGIKGIAQLSFFLSGDINRKGAKKVRSLRGMMSIIGRIFGTFDHVVLVEGPTNRYDHFVFAEKIKGKWYVKAVVSNLLVWLEPYVKSVMSKKK